MMHLSSQGFSPDYIVDLLCFLSAVLLVEIQANYRLRHFPPPAELGEKNFRRHASTANDFKANSRLCYLLQALR